MSGLANRIKTMFANLTFSNLGGTASASQIPDLSTDKLTSGSLGLVRGGTGGTDAASARSNLDVYSKSEVNGMVSKAVYYGTCDTAASTATKVVACPSFTEDSDVAGVVLYVTFANANTAAAASLNVGTAGVASVRALTGVDDVANTWVAGETVEFIFDGTYWRRVDGGQASTSYYGVTKLTDSYSSSDTTTAATPNAVSSGLATREKKYTKATLSIAASSWVLNSTTNFYEYSLSGTYADATYDLEVDLNWDSATADQASDWMACQIVGSYGTNKLVARGGQPSQSYPIVLYVTNRT